MELSELTWKEPDDMGRLQEELQEMADILAGYGYAPDAARETLEVLLIHRQAMNNLNTRIDRLREVWRSVAKIRSCDCGEERLQEALEKYRK